MYSQYGEELFILDYFRRHKPRSMVFCDVGAYDGVTSSNTRALFDLSWSGILVEPHPFSFYELTKNCPKNRCTLVQAAVGNPAKRGRIIRLAVPGLGMEDRTLCTCIPDERMRWPNKQRWMEIDVPLISLREVLLKSVQQVDFLSLDCEGMDPEVMESAGYKRGDADLPMLVMAEHNENRNGALEAMNALMSSLGYEQVFSNPVNVAWAHD